MSEPWCESFDKYVHTWRPINVEGIGEMPECQVCSVCGELRNDSHVHPVKDESSAPVVPMRTVFREVSAEELRDYRETGDKLDFSDMVC